MVFLLMASGGPDKSARGIANGGLPLPNDNYWVATEDDCSRPFEYNRTAEILPTAYVPVVCVPMLVLLCTVGNVMNLFILSRYCRIGAKQVFLLSLAMSDMLAMWSSIPIYLNQNSRILAIDLTANSFLVDSYGVFTWMQYTFCYVSDWILVAFSVERLAAFRCLKHHKGQRWPALALVFLIVVVRPPSRPHSCLFKLREPWFPSFRYYHWWLYREADNSYDQPEWVAQWVRLRQQTDIMCPILVTLTLLIINLWLLTYLKRQLKLSKGLIAVATTTNRQNSLSVNGYSGKNSLIPPTATSTKALPTSSTSRQDNLTRMLLGCVAVYIVTQLPMVLLNTLDHLSNAPFCLFQLQRKAHWEPVILTLALVNYSANFFVYVGTSSKYRRMVNGMGRHVARRRPHPGGGASPRRSITSAMAVSGVIRKSLPFSWVVKQPNGSADSF
ncbi:hypothetical protein BV898_12360 [Hypsibius exemplaris]|uniref:G-protein coupled receptors family 1 profile domain-containing protein n=1 Tax=Hypsibius exemplaris TaxID=2072580 RepID=A0A1W0WDY8_HYPEX|nr:hypothetical protein BV898_12360 [Hypsibius exemplaris]